MMVDPSGLACKAYEIEELADVYFFRPLGMVFARAARRLHLTPTFVTAVAGAIGVAGGALLYDLDFALAGFGLIVLHSILDSSDGQLARMTGQTSEFGAVLDGLAGYVTYAAIYVSIILGSLARGGDRSIIGWAIVAAIANVIHAQMYDYHRLLYARIAITGRADDSALAPRRAGSLSGLLRLYRSSQAQLAGLHHEVEQAVLARASNGVIRSDDRARYRACFYWPVRGWNLLGDNTRFYAIGVFAWLHRLEWFFAFIVIPLNMAFAALWLWQARADRKFLDGL